MIFALITNIVFLIPISLISPLPESLFLDFYFSLKMILVTLLIYSLLYYAFRNYKKSNSKVLFLFSAAFLIYISLLGNVKAHAIKHVGGIYDVEVQFKNGDLLKTSNENIYIGETKNYIFFNNILDGSSEAINKNEAIKIIKNKK